MTREEYKKELKTLTDEIRKKDPSERTYEERWYLWQEKVLNSPLGAPHDCGEEREFYDAQELISGKIKNGFGNDFPKWFREAGINFGKRCITPTKELGTLIGMSETFDDYYYILEMEDGTKHKFSCVGKLEFIE